MVWYLTYNKEDHQIIHDYSSQYQDTGPSGINVMETTVIKVPDTEGRLNFPTTS